MTDTIIAGSPRNVNKFDLDQIAWAHTNGLTVYGADDILEARAEFNEARKSWQYALDTLYDALKPYGDQLITTAPAYDCPDAIKPLFALLVIDGPADDPDSKMPSRSKELYPIQNWKRAAATFRAQTKKLDKAILAVGAVQS